MHKVSVRTLTLMVLLLFSVLAHQYFDWTPTASAGALWLAEEDPNDPPPEIAWLLDNDPNGTDDPPPEITWATADDPNGVDDPPPEITWAVADDPNGVDDPPPEIA